MTAHRALLHPGLWHFQHGPIDLVIGADGQGAAVAAAHEAAWTRFSTLLQELVAELPVLRQPLPPSGELPPAAERLRGTVARRMWMACAPYRDGYITPMAAVAGSVAQELMACYDRPGVERAWVNNGGDIALHLTPGQSVRIGLFADLAKWDSALWQAVAGQTGQTGLATDAQFALGWDMPVRGIATSGWRGRSFSLGIADSVTVLAATAAQADAAATVIANAVNTEHPGIVRRPACELKDDTDLRNLLVTVDVPRLDAAAVREALQAGQARAHTLRRAGLIASAVLACQGQWAVVGDDPLAITAQTGSVFA